MSYGVHLGPMYRRGKKQPSREIDPGGVFRARVNTKLDSSQAFWFWYIWGRPKWIRDWKLQDEASLHFQSCR
jgi:hypothetical protein